LMVCGAILSAPAPFQEYPRRRAQSLPPAVAVDPTKPKNIIVVAMGNL